MIVLLITISRTGNSLLTIAISACDKLLMRDLSAEAHYLVDLQSSIDHYVEET